MLILKGFINRKIEIMDGHIDDSLPFLRHFDGSQLILKLGDTQCLYSTEMDFSRVAPSSFFLPGKKISRTFCTFSALFDGSVVLSKESNTAPEIFCNGNRIPTGVNVAIQSGDSIILGSSEYGFMVDLNDFDEQDGNSRCESKSLEDMLSEVIKLMHFLPF